MNVLQDCSPPHQSKQNDKMDYILCGRYFSADILPKHLFIESGNNKLKSRVLPRLHAKCTSKVTFREVLTMLAVFDCIFIRFDCTSVLPQIVCFCHVCCWYCAFSYFSCCSTVSTTFGLPQLSVYWKVIQLFYLKSWLLEKHFRLPSANQLMLINEHWDYFLPRPGSTLIYSPTFFHLYRLHVL